MKSKEGDRRFSERVQNALVEGGPIGHIEVKNAFLKLRLPLQAALDAAAYVTQ